MRTSWAVRSHLAPIPCRVLLRTPAMKHSLQYQGTFCSPERVFHILSSASRVWAVEGNTNCISRVTRTQ